MTTLQTVMRARARGWSHTSSRSLQSISPVPRRSSEAVALPIASLWDSPSLVITHSPAFSL